jgi:hypothetical protein
MVMTVSNILARKVVVPLKEKRESSGRNTHVRIIQLISRRKSLCSSTSKRCLTMMKKMYIELDNLSRRGIHKN